MGAKRSFPRKETTREDRKGWMDGRMDGGEKERRLRRIVVLGDC